MTPATMAALHGLCFTVPKPWSETDFASLLADPLCFALTEAEGLLLGRAVAGEAELLTLAVAPLARRRGVGARLVTGFLQQARQRGANTAFLEVAQSNAAAISLYRAHGFAEAGRRRGYYTGGVDALILRCELAST